MAEALPRKKKIRAGHRASATRLLNQIDAALREEPPNTEHLTLLKMSLKEKLDTLKSLDSEIEELIPEEELVKEIEQADEYKENVYRALTKIEKAQMVISAISTTSGTSASPASGRSSSPTTPPRLERAKLPKLTLPRFSGDVMKWTTFWDSYESAVHNNDQLSDVDKFNYLRSLLERTAYEAIAGLTLSSANYAEAIDILKKRFGDQQLIISRHMETLLNIDIITSDQNVRGLRRLYDNVESHVRSLKALGVNPDTYGTMLSSILLNKLPPELCLIVSRQVSGSALNIDTLMKTVEEELTARERTTNLTQPTPPRRGQDKEKWRSTATTLLTDAQSSISCCYCQETHPSIDCPKILDARSRRQFLRSSGRCFNCLRKGHLGRECKSPNRCRKCRKKHHSSICDALFPDQKSPSGSFSNAPQATNVTTSQLNPEAPPYVSTPTSSNMCSNSQRTVLLQTARARVHNPTNPRHSVEVRILLDSGSQRSYVTDRVMKSLALEPSGEHQLAIAAFGSQREKPKVYPVVNVMLATKGYPHIQLSLFVVPMICEPLACQPISACIDANRHLANLELVDISDGTSCLEVDILIGSDHYWSLVTGEVCRGTSSPIAVHTKLGWVLSGPTFLETPEQSSVNLITTHVLRADALQSDTESLDATLRSFWELESLGICGPEKTVHDEFIDTVTFKDGRYQVSLPWKEFHKPLGDNYQLSLNRLWGLLRRLKHNPAILKGYDSIIKDQLTKGIVEPVPEEITPSSNRLHYLPHHAIIRSDKSTTRVRIVYDTSAKADGPSLNAGPKFNQHILDILLRFRYYRVALAADIEKAFLMISITEQDRDVLRFLWVDDIMKDAPEVRPLRFTRVVFGVSSSPFLLNATIKHHLEQFAETYPHLVPKLIHSAYVDDIVTGASSHDEAFNLYSESKELFLRGGFNLRKFLTNSQPLQQRINGAENSQNSGLPRSRGSDLDETYVQATLGNLQQSEPQESKILGVRWNPHSDHLIFDVTDVAQLAASLEPTKRNVVSTIGRLYDPIGLLSPVIIPFKVLFQKLCELKVEWDQTLPDELLQEWKILITNLQKGKRVTIPRCYLAGVEEDITYHLCGFCDASSRAYAAVVYLILQSDTRTVVRFVVAKTRVAPLQMQTIPRLELLSALLLSRLIVTTADGLKPVLPTLSLKCYTDSQVTLYWIRGVDKEWKPFVRNRVTEIRRNVPPDCWSHCPGETNPADLPSRGLTPSRLSDSKLWYSGPEWLSSPTSSPPESPEPSSIPEGCLSEIRSKVQSVHNLAAVEQTLTLTLRNVIDCERYSSITKLMRVTAYVLRAVKIFKKTQLPQSTDGAFLIAEDLADAERAWIIEVQKTLANEEKFPLWKRQFDLFLDSKGLWRCRGRLGNVDIPYTTRHPVLLPREHPITTLIIREAHRRVQHNGVKETLTEIRRKFWIVKARSLVKSLIHRCVTCRRFEGAAYRGPPPPPLPIFRVREEPPFTYTGVDFAGPLYVRTTGSSTMDKAWICLFTCCVIRAIHLEIMTDLSTGTFIRCLKRFTARRGIPRKFVSDNGKTFKAAAKVLKAVLDDDMVLNHLAGVGIEWVFNIERAPWWGGVFERMVRSTKRCLKKMIGQAKLTLDEVHTAVVEIESIINSRPLSYLSSTDIEEPLTPSHLMVGRRILNLPDDLGHLIEPGDEEFTTNPAHLRRRTRHLNNMLNHFWKRWRGEYLVELRESHKQLKPNLATQPAISPGAVVVHDEGLPRGFWKLGKVEEVLVGRDGQVRGAVVRLGSRNRQNTLIRRPVQLLYPLEVHDVTEDSSASSDHVARQECGPSDQAAIEIPAQQDSTRRRSSRIATNHSDDRRRALLLQSEDIS